MGLRIFLVITTIEVNLCEYYLTRRQTKLSYVHKKFPQIRKETVNNGHYYVANIFDE